MSQQGDPRTGQEDAWWGELYDKNAPDIGSAAGDDSSLDERFTSASAVVRAESCGERPKRAQRAVKAPRAEPPDPPRPPDPVAVPPSGLPSLPKGYGAPRARGVPGRSEFTPPPPPSGAERLSDGPAPARAARVPLPRIPKPPDLHGAGLLPELLEKPQKWRKAGPRRPSEVPRQPEGSAPPERRDPRDGADRTARQGRPDGRTGAAPPGSMGVSGPPAPVRRGRPAPDGPERRPERPERPNAANGAATESAARAPRPARPETGGRTARPPRSERTDRCEGADLFFGGRTPRRAAPVAEDRPGTVSAPGAGNRDGLAPRPPEGDDVAQEPAGLETAAAEGTDRRDRPGRAAPRYADGGEPSGGLGFAEAADRASGREAAGYGPPESTESPEAASAPPATEDATEDAAERRDRSEDRYADGGEPPDGFGPAEATERAGALDDTGYGPLEGPGTRAARSVRADLVARRKRSGGRSGPGYAGGDGIVQEPGPADRSGGAEPAGRPERPASGSEPPPRPAGPAGRRELLEGYERMDGPEPEPEPEAPDRQERQAALPERPERLRRTGRLERPTRPVRTERPVRPPRLPRQESPQPAPPARPDPYERPDLPDLSDLSGLPDLPGQSLPAVPDQPGPGASPARTRSAQPPRTAPPGGNQAEPLEPAARAASLEPASRPPVVSRESTPPRRQPLAAPAQPAPRAAPGAEFVGQRPPTYDAEPTAWPAADPQDLEGLVPDTVLDGAQYGAVTLRAVSLRGDSARYRGEPRRDALLTARFGDGDGALLLVAMAAGLRGTDVAPRAARDACRWLAGAVGRSHARLADDIRGGRRGELKSGLHRLTDRSYGRLRARAAELGLRPDAYTATVRCLLLTADPQCRTRVFFGVGAGGLFRLREGVWQDLEPDAPPERTGEPVAGYGAAPADTMTVDLGIPTPGLTPPVEPEEPAVPGEPFRFRASVARPGDTLMLCTAGLAEPMRGEPELGGRLAERWAGARPPGLAAFLADTQLRVKGYADDRTACALWEA